MRPIGPRSIVEIEQSKALRRFAHLGFGYWLLAAVQALAYQSQDASSSQGGDGLQKRALRPGRDWRDGVDQDRRRDGLALTRQPARDFHGDQASDRIADQTIESMRRCPGSRCGRKSPLRRRFEVRRHRRRSPNKRPQPAAASYADKPASYPARAGRRRRRGTGKSALRDPLAAAAPERRASAIQRGRGKFVLRHIGLALKRAHQGGEAPRKCENRFEAKPFDFARSLL